MHPLPALLSVLLILLSATSAMAKSNQQISEDVIPSTQNNMRPARTYDHDRRPRYNADSYYRQDRHHGYQSERGSYNDRYDRYNNNDYDRGRNDRRNRW